MGVIVSTKKTMIFYEFLPNPLKRGWIEKQICWITSYQYYKVPLFFWFDLQTRAKILKPILLVFLVKTMEQKRHFEINWPLVQQYSGEICMSSPKISTLSVCLYWRWLISQTDCKHNTINFLLHIACHMHCTTVKVENVLKGSLDSIPSPSPSEKIQITGGKVYLRCKGKTLLGRRCQQSFESKKFCWHHPAVFCLIALSKLSYQ